MAALLGALATHAAFDPSKFPSEVQEMQADVNSGIDDTQFEALIELLQRLAHSGADVSHDPNLEHGMEALQQAVEEVPVTGGEVFTDQLATSAVHTLNTEGHCQNIFGFLAQLHHDGVDFSHDQELQSTMNNLNVQLEQGLGGGGGGDADHNGEVRNQARSFFNGLSDIQANSQEGTAQQ
ncbi:hypothetical protein PV04_10968 [Phialophora macrospora]|uniref:Uncharacterized protein n=1 Tax=Phialophora macrospora TaxID=1851006 RepID=A0A0D2F4L0_9EURO|nr:hypothetical protein PV04_10968 [Phialophora macrospora]